VAELEVQFGFCEPYPTELISSAPVVSPDAGGANGYASNTKSGGQFHDM
jgi:hypothetical protein